MKKNYIEPTMRTVALQRPNLLNGSLNDGDSLSITISDTGAEADADAHEFGFDDDEY